MQAAGAEARDTGGERDGGQGAHARHAVHGHRLVHFGAASTLDAHLTNVRQWLVAERARVDDEIGGTGTARDGGQNDVRAADAEAWRLPLASRYGTEKKQYASQAPVNMP